MLTKSRLSHLRSLRQKKFRNEHGLFVAEGDKLVPELLQSSFKVETIYATEDWLKENAKLLKHAGEHMAVTKDELSRISSLVTPQRVLAVAGIPQYTLEEKQILSRYSLLLDGIRDPGNMGTIIRIADWFGIHDIICSPDSAEVWNPKVVQASMGSLLRVRTHIIEPVKFLERMKEEAAREKIKMPVAYGTFLEGDNIYKTTFAPAGIIVIGNEANGIGDETAALIDRRITIPPVLTGEKNGRPESLNAAVATAVVCAEMRRNN
jgi:TrmH family RNA methyltransferase